MSDRWFFRHRQEWIADANPGIITYNRSSKRYEAIVTHKSEKPADVE